jgi:hypothetical protein
MTKVFFSILLFSPFIFAEEPANIRECSEKLVFASQLYKSFKAKSNQPGAPIALAAGMLILIRTTPAQQLDDVAKAFQESVNRLTDNVERDYNLDAVYGERARDIRNPDRPGALQRALAHEQAVKSEIEAGRIEVARAQAEVDAIRQLEKSRRKLGLSLKVNDIVAETIEEGRALTSLDLTKQLPGVAGTADDVQDGMRLVVKESGKSDLKGVFVAAEEAINKRELAGQIAKSDRLVNQLNAELKSLRAFVQYVKASMLGNTPLRAALKYTGSAFLFLGAVETIRTVMPVSLYAASGDDDFETYTREPYRVFEALSKNQYTPEHFCRRIDRDYALGNAVNGEISKMYAGTNLKAPTLFVGPTMQAARRVIPAGTPASTQRAPWYTPTGRR